MAYTPAGVVSYGFPIDDFTFTYLLSGSPVVGTDEGKPVTQDITAANTFKVVGDGDVIRGRLFSIQKDTVLGITTGAVQRVFKEKFAAAVGHGIIVGDRILGAANGLVKKDAAAGVSNPLVVEVGTDYVVAEKL